MLKASTISQALWELVLLIRVIYEPGPAETVGQVGHLPYHFLVVHTGNGRAMIIRDSELRSQSRYVV